MSSVLATRVLSLHNTYLSAMAEDRHLGHQKGEWESLEKDISSARLEGVLSQEEASIASAVASNVLAYSHLCRDLKDVYDCELDKLSSAVKDILSLNEFPGAHSLSIDEHR